MGLVRPKRKILLFPETRWARKIFIRATANQFFLINLIEFFKQSLPFIVRREKTSFRPNIFASGKPP